MRPVGARRSEAHPAYPLRARATPVQRPNLRVIAPRVIRNQQAVGACRGEALATCLEPFCDWGTPSGIWLYKAGLYLAQRSLDSGLTIGEVTRAAREVGTLKYTPNECDDPLATATITGKMPDWAVGQSASTRYAIDLQSVDVMALDAFDAICDAIEATRRPQPWASYVNAGFMALKPDETAIQKHFSNDGTGGGHAMAWCGYDRRKKCLLGLTSWGNWGGTSVMFDGGYVCDWPGAVEVGDYTYQLPGDCTYQLPGAFWVDASALPAIWETQIIVSATELEAPK